MTASGSMTAPPDWWFAEVPGDRLAAFYKWHAVGDKSHRARSDALRKLRNFCRRRALPTALPSNTLIIDAWVASMGKDIQATTIKQHLSVLRVTHIDIGLDPVYLTHPCIERTIRGIKRFHGVKTTKQALPITLPILRKLVATLDDFPAIAGGDQNAATCAAAFTLAFAGFFRMGEITFRAPFRSAFNMRRGDIDFDRRTAYLPASKTDPFRKGTVVHLPSAVDAAVDPIRRLRLLFARYPADSTEPLFVFSSARTFPRDRVVVTLKAALQQAGYRADQFTGHSFRRGAATWAASLGIRDEEIMRLGRWTSQAWKLYVDTKPNEKQALINHLFAHDAEHRSTLPRSGVAPHHVRWAPGA